MRNLLLSLRVYLCNHVIAHVPSHLVRLGYYRRVMHAEIGRGSSIHLGAQMDSPGGLTIGAGSTVNERCRLDTRGGITIGDHVSVSGDVVLLTADHDLRSPGFDGRTRGIRIEDYVFVGTRAVILPGVTIGRGAAVAVGSVVSKDVVPGAIVAGAPAREIGTRGPEFDYDPSYRRLLF